MSANNVSLTEAMDSFFDDDFDIPLEIPSMFSELDTVKFPQVDIAETKNKIILKATIPGMDPKNIKLEVTNDAISLSSEQHEDSQVLDGDFLQQECYYGSFQRAFALPSEINPEKVSAEAHNGILTITLPKITTKKTAPKKKAVTKKAAPKKKVVTKKTASKKKVVAKKTASKKKVVAKKTAPKKKVVAKKTASKKKVVAKKAAPKKKVVAKKAAPKKKVVAKKTAPKKKK